MLDGDDSRRSFWLEKCVEFVSEIGLPVRFTQDVPSGFLTLIAIEDGGLVIHSGAFPGDVLHEAGHLCTIPTQFRHLASGNLRAVFREMADFLDENPEGIMSYPENPVHRACMQCTDPEATAWQYAAAQHIGLPEEWLFPADAYGGEAKATYFSLANNAYFGINGLQAAGWTRVRNLPMKTDTPVYPKLAFWLFP